jgi:hypothetical protein
MLTLEELLYPFVGVVFWHRVNDNGGECDLIVVILESSCRDMPNSRITCVGDITGDPASATRVVTTAADNTVRRYES